MSSAAYPNAFNALCGEPMPESVREVACGWLVGLPTKPGAAASCDLPAGHSLSDKHAWRRAMQPAIEWTDES